MANEKQDHMALIAIVGIVAIVGLFLMFFSQGRTTNTDTNGDLAGQAIRITQANIKENLDNEQGDFYALLDCLEAGTGDDDCWEAYWGNDGEGAEAAQKIIDIINENSGPGLGKESGNFETRILIEENLDNEAWDCTGMTPEECVSALIDIINSKESEDGDIIYPDDSDWFNQ